MRRATASATCAHDPPLQRTGWPAAERRVRLHGCRFRGGRNHGSSEAACITISIQAAVERLIDARSSRRLLTPLSESHGDFHAEQNALLSAARFGIAVEGVTICSTMQPCFGCGKELLQARVMRIVYLPSDADPQMDSNKEAEHDKLLARLDTK